ncbi:hypothetical protein [Paenibacillus sp. A3M_27_13]|uniref:hypothetical protein n=1 Tax=Paenibacillus sp. A3M_27_13 TaxID=2962029 RepID=UPI000FB64CD6|nr:hypothetical protein [Paenibacillus sp. A3M_27_13]MCP3744262.1 hypothetical protein [Paenibacillus sp. A3M_27_13]
MASEKTPNLGLNQIDRTSPKTTYFDLEKYLDQNWRAVDDFAGDVNNGVNEIKKRLDTTERKTVTLEPGVQILNAVKAAPFSLSGITGRMLVNLLGRAGSGDQIGSLLGWEADLAVDTSNKAQGMGSIKVTAKNATGVYNVYSSGLKLTGGRYYIALADVKNINASNNIYVNFSTGGNKALKQSIDKSQFVTIYTKCAPANDTAINLEVSAISTATGQAFYADAIRLYEVSASEYAALDSMVAEQVAAKYPYVDSVTPVRNPYAIRYGENLLPSFYEWGLHANMKAAGPYSLSLAATASFQAANVYVPVVSGKAYTISGEVTGILYMAFEDANGNVVGGGNNTSTPLPLTFTASANASRLRVTIDNGNTSTGTFTFSNLMLNIGSTAKPFKPREDSMLALQTDLYADPVTGANADTVYERDGQYFKSKRFQGLILDGSRAWVNGDTSAAGLKQVKVVGLAAGAVAGSGIGTKFDGKLLPQGTTGSTPDTNAITPAGDVYISIPVADSGWADGYYPTQEDIKAYFYGYKAYDANTITPAQAQAATTATWSGTGTKYWVQRVGAANFTQSFPQTSYAGYTPYRLVYQLATPTVEPIVSEGQFSFVEGDNQVEVGTGIVLRESAKPQFESVGINYQINSSGLPESLLKNRVKKILHVFRSSKRDTTFRIVSTTDPSGDIAYTSNYNYITSEVYSVTYFIQDSIPVAPFTGSYAANEKTLLADLVDTVQQANTRLSVVENKKADKDNPAWIIPTLVNGWVSVVGGAPYTASYYKDSLGIVHMRGWVTGGVTAQATTIFTLPVGYRPKQRGMFVVYDTGGAGTTLKFATISVNLDGRVTVDAISGVNIGLDQVSFLAEQ